MFLSLVDDAVLRHGIGVMLFVLGLLQLVIQRAEREIETHASSRWASLSTGLAAGFTTMTANAAGAVMTLYLVARGVDKRRFLGTNAVFFLGVNLCKLPFSAGLGLFSGATLVRSLALAPAVLLGTWVGLRTAQRLSQAHFDRAVLVATLVSAAVLIVA
ncbi:sulfite exporter TauE/SafE family protein [Nostocoides sp. HKS02]|uniref:sulfite exporter TauE/SafE family protein n=1 Tax=Nostocoides sp. HKS02 TaxID=1813880 RepID=UPI002103AB8C|nr:sulfite exporter TauE/SafE family protein [Tetrasphaera sp. HKS02]